MLAIVAEALLEMLIMFICGVWAHLRIYWVKAMWFLDIRPFSEQKALKHIHTLVKTVAILSGRPYADKLRLIRTIAFTNNRRFIVYTAELGDTIITAAFRKRLWWASLDGDSLDVTKGPAEAMANHMTTAAKYGA